MSRTITSTLLASGALVLGLAASTSAEERPAPRVASGIYDSFGRQKGPDNRLPQNDRVVQIQALSLGGLRITVYDGNGRLQGTQFLVPKYPVSYDAQLASYFQNFETVPATKSTPVEQVQFVFRINDPTGDYDVYFSQPGHPQTSEVLLRRSR